MHILKFMVIERRRNFIYEKNKINDYKTEALIIVVLSKWEWEVLLKLKGVEKTLNVAKEKIR